MKRHWATGMAGALLLVAGSVASAQPGPRGGGEGPRGGGRFMQGHEGGMNPGGRGSRSGEMGAERGGEKSGERAMHRDGGPMGPAHLSPDERRQLRREIHEAGRDIYRPRRPDR